MPSFDRSIYVDPQHIKFIRDMEEAGFELQHYNGRFFYQGPAVVVEPNQEHDVIRATDVRLQRDSMGRDIILYPPTARGAALLVTDKTA